MIQDAYINHKEGNECMNNVSIADIASFVSIGIAVGSVIYWGGGLEKRVRAIESWKNNIDSQLARIENKIDLSTTQTTARIDQCQQSLLDAIMKR